MASKRWVSASSVLLSGALVVAACGDDPPAGAGSDGGSAGQASAGESSSAAGVGATGTGVDGGKGGGSGAPGSAGSSEEGGAGLGGASGAGLSIDEFCDTLQVRAREWLRACRFSFGDASGWWGAQNIDGFCSSGRDAIDAGRLIYDPAQAEACAALSLDGCQDIEAFAFGVGSAQAGLLQSSECQGVVAGTVALGDECHAHSTKYASECAEGFCSSNACPGICSAYSEVGGDCDGFSTACDPALAYCDGQNKCQAYGALGDTCTVIQCAPGDLCRYDAEQQLDVCVGQVALGDDCAPRLNQCRGLATCLEGTCVAAVALDEPCLSNANCPATAYCAVTCQPRAALTESCANGVQCVEGAGCAADICVSLGGAGEGCPCAAGLWCDAANECQPRGDVGDECNPQFLGTCAVPLFCDPATSTCAERAALDETCNFAHPLDSCADGLHCSCAANCQPAHLAPATCKPRLADADDCRGAAECLSGICTASKCVADPSCR
jgi:hypothetical protein